MRAGFHIAFVLPFISIILGASPQPSAATETATAARITVRTYDATPLSPDDRVGALATATRILQTAGLDVQWLSCDSIGRALPEAILEQLYEWYLAGWVHPPSAGYA